MRRRNKTLICAGLLIAVTGLQAQTAPADSDVRKLLSGISPDRIGAAVKTLAAFETRGDYSDPGQKTRGIGAARRWIFDQLHSYSPRLEVTYDIGKKGVTDIASVIAVLPGTSQPEKRILVTAHYDSVNSRGKGANAAEAPAPGADDDASGTAVVLELARVMSQYRFRMTIVFAAFAGEEIGLVGSTRYANRAKAGGERIVAVLNNDIVGSNVLGIVHNEIDGTDEEVPGTDGDTGNLLRVFSPDPPDSASRKLARLVQDAALRYVPGIRIELVSRADRFDRAGDHIPFQTNGFAAVRFTSASEHSESQHTANDLPEGVSAEFTARVARVNAATVAGLAGLPGSGR